MISLKRWFVSTAVPKPANIRMVQSRDRYMEACTHGCRGTDRELSVLRSVDRVQRDPDIVANTASRLADASYSASHWS